MESYSGKYSHTDVQSPYTYSQFHPPEFQIDGLRLPFVGKSSHLDLVIQVSKDPEAASDIPLGPPIYIVNCNISEHKFRMLTSEWVFKPQYVCLCFIRESHEVEGLMSGLWLNLAKPNL